MEVVKEVVKLAGLLTIMIGGLLIACIPVATIIMLFFWLVG